MRLLLNCSNFFSSLFKLFFTSLFFLFCFWCEALKWSYLSNFVKDNVTSYVNKGLSQKPKTHFDNKNKFIATHGKPLILGKILNSWFIFFPNSYQSTSNRLQTFWFSRNALGPLEAQNQEQTLAKALLLIPIVSFFTHLKPGKGQFSVSLVTNSLIHYA